MHFSLLAVLAVGRYQQATPAQGRSLLWRRIADMAMCRVTCPRTAMGRAQRRREHTDPARARYWSKPYGPPSAPVVGWSHARLPGELDT